MQADIEMKDETGQSKEDTKPTEDEKYIKYKKLQKELELLEIQENYIKEETNNLKLQYSRGKQEIKIILGTPLMIGQFTEMIDENYALVTSNSGNQYCVRVLSTINREDLKAGGSVAMHKTTHSIVDILPPEADSTIQMTKITEKPDVTYQDIGGLDVQKQEIREAVELPLTHPELYQQIGIDPPGGVLLYGPPGTGKTMLAKAVANHTTASFIRVCGSEFVQKYLGEGPKMVRDVFRLARENAPSIVFIDEIDTIGARRYDSTHGSDREVQRILVELLTQMDGFDPKAQVKVIMATNRQDILDPALMRPGRLDRKIEISLPNESGRVDILKIHSKPMTKKGEIEYEALAKITDGFNGADLRNVCTEAGMFAIRAQREFVIQEDFMAHLFLIGLLMDIHQDLKKLI